MNCGRCSKKTKHKTATEDTKRAKDYILKLTFRATASIAPRRTPWPLQAARSLRRQPTATSSLSTTLPNPYTTISDWAKTPAGFVWGGSGGIGFDPAGNVWALQALRREHVRRCNVEDPILEFDKTGKFIKSFGAGVFVTPHGRHGGRQEGKHHLGHRLCGD